jgi:hypothetical protein
MPRIRIAPDQTMQLASKFDTNTSSLKNISAQISSASSKLIWSVRSKANIDSSINNAISASRSLSNELSLLSTYVKNATSKFVEADKTNEISISKVSDKYTKQYDSISGASKGKNPSLFSSGVCKMVGKLGPIGSVALIGALPICLWADNKIFKPGITGAEYNAKIIDNLDEAAKGIIDITKWATSGDKDFKKLLWGNIQTSKAASAVWAGTDAVFTLAKNIILNVGEAQQTNMSGTRIVSEVVLETAIDIGTKWAIRSAIAAGIAAATGAAAAPILVGVTAVAAGFAIDLAVKKITGAVTGTEKGLTEVISDGILDFLSVGTTETNKSGRVTSPPVMAASNKMMGFT